MNSPMAKEVNVEMQANKEQEQSARADLAYFVRRRGVCMEEKGW